MFKYHKVSSILTDLAPFKSVSFKVLLTILNFVFDKIYLLSYTRGPKQLPINQPEIGIFILGQSASSRITANNFGHGLGQVFANPDLLRWTDTDGLGLLAMNRRNKMIPNHA